jgi:tRNA A37 threonylcarbamoyladenosine modification protein TsaB
MDLFIDLNRDKFTLLLKDGESLVDSLEMCFERDLAEKLLEGIDKILKSNRIDKTDLKSIDLSKKPDKDRTSDRIALSVVGAFKALKNK